MGINLLHKDSNQVVRQFCFVKFGKAFSLRRKRILSCTLSALLHEGPEKILLPAVDLMWAAREKAEVIET